MEQIKNPCEQCRKKNYCSHSCAKRKEWVRLVVAKGFFKKIMRGM